MRGAKTGVQKSFAGLNKSFIRPPPSGGVALLVHKLQSVARGAKILLVSEDQIRLHGRTECIYVTVGVLPWKYVLPFREGPEIVLLDKPHREIAITRITAALVR